MNKIAKLFSLLLAITFVFGLVACVEPEPDPDPTPVTEINALGGFVDGGDAVYTLDINSANALSLSFNKSTFSFANVMKSLTGDFSEMNTLKITLQGSGVAVLIKLQNEDGTIAREVQVNANPTQQTVSWDLSEESALLDVLTKVLVFAAPGKTSVSGSILISEMKFAEALATGTVIESGHSDFVAPDPNTYTGQEGNFELQNFYDGGDGFYDVEKVGSSYVVDYVKPTGANDWAFFRTDLVGEFSDFARLVFEFTSTVDVDVLFKLEGTAGNKEVRVTGTGQPQTLIIDLLSLLPAQLDNTDKIVIFGSPGAPGAGQITLSSVRFERAAINYNKNWVALDAGVYTFTEQNDGSTDVAYNKNAEQGYSVAKLDIPAEYQMLNKMTVTLSGVAGTTFIIKPNDQQPLEKTVTLSSTDPESFVFENPSGFTNIIFFALPDIGNVSGTFTIESVILDYVPRAFDPTTTVEANDAWVVNDAGSYEVTYESDGKAKFVYSIASYQFVRHTFDVEAVAGLNTLTVVISGQTGKNVLLKPNDSNALENRVEFLNSDPVTLVFYADGFNQMLMFAEGGADSAFGTFYIHSMTLSYTNEPEIVSNDHYIVTPNGDVYDVAFTKAGDPYRFLRVTFDPLLTTGLNTLTVTVSGTIGESFLIKPNDMGSLERMVNFTDDQPKTETFTFDGFTQLIMFAQPGNADATGTFVIHAISLTYVAPETPDFDVTSIVDGNIGHMSLEAGVYTFTDVSGGVKVDYDKAAGQDWSAAVINFDAEDVLGLNTMHVVLSGGTPGKQVLLKPNDNSGLEKWLTFDLAGNAEAILHHASGYTKLVFFGEGGVSPVTGSFVIDTIELSYQVDLLSLAWESLVAGVYTLTPTTDGVSVAYAKNAGDNWAAIKALVEGALGLNTLRVVISGGVEGQRVLLKPNDNGALEQMLTFDANGEIVIDIDITTEIISMVVFVLPDVAPAQGTVVFESMTLLYQD